MRAILMAASCAAWLLVGQNVAHAMPKPVPPPPVVVPAFPDPAALRTVKLVRAVVSMADGAVWGQVGSLPCDLDRTEYRWESSKSEFDTDRFSSTFDNEMAKAGLKKAASASLFDEASSSDDMQVAIRILDIKLYICRGVFGDQGTSTMSVEWQVFDPLKREVVARVQTTGGAQISIKGPGDVTAPVFQAFRENSRVLLADPAFRAALLKTSTVTSLNEGERAPITITARSAALRPIGEVSASVVAVFTGNAMGSGFLVSDDGYILTNHHVVGGATKVRVRWSDGLESTGEVIRSDKRRDVALVKVEPRGRPALALLRGTPAVGASVYAVGTPLDEMLQNTVTRGIISANRFIDGFAYIQSDVSVDHGNSGGPLLDEKGRVIGITVIKFAPDDCQRNLNLFIPIGDALDFLALKTGG